MRFLCMLPYRSCMPFGPIFMMWSGHTAISSMYTISCNANTVLGRDVSHICCKFCKAFCTPAKHVQPIVQHLTTSPPSQGIALAFWPAEVNLQLCWPIPWRPPGRSPPSACMNAMHVMSLLSLIRVKHHLVRGNELPRYVVSTA